MEKFTLKTEILKASDGMIITDGKIYGRTIYLGNGRKTDEFHEITEDEYAEIQRKPKEETETEAGEE